MKSLFCLLCFLMPAAVMTVSYGQHSPSPWPTFRIANGKTSFSVPFELVDNPYLIIVGPDMSNIQKLGGIAA